MDIKQMLIILKGFSPFPRVGSVKNNRVEEAYFVKNNRVEEAYLFFSD